MQVADSGNATYLAACLGVKPSGGFSVAIESAWSQGNAVTVDVLLEEPEPDGVAFAAITSPFALAVIPGRDPKVDTFTVVASLGWKLVRVGG